MWLYDVVLQDPINHLLRRSADILTGSTAATSVQQASSNSSRVAACGSSSVVPVTRDEAIQLEVRLAEALPSGAILADQQAHLVAWRQQQQRQWKQQLAVHAGVQQHYEAAVQQQQAQCEGQLPECDVLSAALTAQHQLMDNLLREAAQQVGVGASQIAHVWCSLLQCSNLTLPDYALAMQPHCSIVYRLAGVVPA